MSHNYTFFLGSHPDISSAEAWHVLKSQQYKPTLVEATPQILRLTLAKSLPADFIDILGGTDRIAQEMGTLPSPPPPDTLLSLLFSDTPKSPAIKHVIGVSNVGFDPHFNKVLGSDLKKLARQQSIRLKFIIPVSGTRLNAAQVTFNKLDVLPNFEVTLIKTTHGVVVAKTTHVQDIAAYELRDTLRPVRDPLVGMLPPKLAQIMLNVAVSQLPVTDYQLPITAFDPFCGLGTIVQEAWLRDLKCFGSDKNPDMIAATKKNLAWLTEHFHVSTSLQPDLFVHDATSPLPAHLHASIDSVVFEPYLGKPLTSPLPRRELNSHINALASLYSTAVSQLSTCLKSNGTMLLVLPAFRTKRRAETFSLLPDTFLDAVADQGYSQIQPIPPELAVVYPSSPRSSLLYARPDALVGREITLWQKR